MLLTTERLTLRRPRMADVDELVRLIDNIRIAEMTARIPHPYAFEDAFAFVESMAAFPSNRGPFAVIRTADGTLLGCCGIEDDRGRPDGTGVGVAAPKLGYWIGEPYWGNGYATEAGMALVNMAFGDATVGCIDSSCRTTNSASRRVLLKCGFRFHGTAMTECRALDHEVEVELCRLDRADWEALAASQRRGLWPPARRDR